MVPVRLASEMTSFWREEKVERLEGTGRPRGTDWMTISVTKPLGEQVMKAHLQGLVSKGFQLRKGGGEEEKEEREVLVGCVWSHERRVRDSWFAEVVTREREKRRRRKM